MIFQKYKPKVKQRLLLILLALALTTTSIFIMQTPLKVHAYNGGEGTGGSGGLGTLEGGASTEKTGILLYFVYNNDVYPATGGVFISRDANASMYNQRLTTKTQFHLATTSTLYSNHMPYPVSWTGKQWVSNGYAVREWLLTPNPSNPEELVYEAIVRRAWPDLAEDMLSKTKLSIVVQPVAWMNEYVHGVNTRKVLCATADGWAEFYNEEGEPKGDSYTYKMTHMALPYSMVLETERFGLAPHNGEAMQRISGDDIMSSGYGIHIIDLKSDSNQTTCDEPKQPTPHKAPGESKGTATIVKNYRTKNNTTGAYTDDGCYVRDKVSNEITIENESSYKIAGWKISTTVDESIDSTKWETEIPSVITQTGTSTDSVTLGTTEKCLYVLLEKVEEEKAKPLDANYILTQSQITRRITLSNPDAQLAMPKIQDHTFKWEISAHKTSCSGHSYKDGCKNHDSDGDGKKDSCGGHTAYCKGWEWKDQSLKFSIVNSLRTSYPNILSTKTNWDKEVKVGSLTKHYISKTRDTTSATSYSENRWDYVCIIHRGQDHLTVAQWKNNSMSNPSNTTLSDSI